MEFKRTKVEDEIVLTCCPGCEEVELRYERELPLRMREEPFPPAAETARGADPYVRRHRRERRWIAAILISLSIVILTGSVVGGVWLYRLSQQQQQQEELPEFALPPGWEVTDGETEKPVEEIGMGAPTIAAYRPGSSNVPRFRIGAVSEDMQTLSAGEIYRKIFPSTVTIIGYSGDKYSVGTGIIFTEDGYIMTNYHVIAGCEACEVWVTDEYGIDTTYEALYVGGGEDQDLAVLKIDARGLMAAEFGVSSDLSVGDKVYAIGNPLGLELRSTFTDGIVSAVDRNVAVDGVTMTLLQTNAALNSGNSGGPLVNAYGQVVGINTIKMMSGYDTIEGLGFAIPSGIAERMINDILQTGEIRPQPLLGVMVNRIPTALPDGTTGLEVVEVTPGLGAEKAGVQVGDYVVAFNGVDVSRVDDIYAQRQGLSVGDLVSIRVFRDGEYLEFTMIMMAEAAD